MAGATKTSDKSMQKQTTVTTLKTIDSGSEESGSDDSDIDALLSGNRPSTIAVKQNNLLEMDPIAGALALETKLG